MDEPYERTAYRVFHWLAIVSSAVLLIWGLAAGVLTYGASWTPWALVVMAIVHLLAVSLYGDWALNRQYTSQVYVYWVILYFLEISFCLLGGLALVRIGQVRTVHRP